MTWVEKGVLKNLVYDRAVGDAAEEGPDADQPEPEPRDGRHRT